MKIRSLWSMIAVCAVLSTSSCIDDKYDLSDIDTTSRIEVNNLTVPINIDKISLKSIIDIDDNDEHIKVIDGAYAYVQTGTFTSGAISVPEVVINNAITSKVDIDIPLNLPAINEGVYIPVSVPVALPAKTAAYQFAAEGISDDICGLTQVNGECDVTIDVAVGGLENLDVEYDLVDLKLQLPDGMQFDVGNAGTYDPATAVITINQKPTTPKFSLTLKATGLTLAEGAFDEAKHSINVNGTVGISSGTLNVKMLTPATGIPDHLAFTVAYKFGNMKVTSVDGTIRHAIADVNVPDININDLPDLLKQSGTNLLLTNPCLYLAVNNPLYSCGAYGQTGFEITSYHGEASKVYTIDDKTFTIAAAETDKYCFSPVMPQTPDAAYAGCQHIAFTSLSDVLSGDGLPDKLKVALTDPSIPRQAINGFKLGHDYGTVKGDYKFVAPLQFNEGTQIVYGKTTDGWYDDVKDLTITRLDVNLTVTTDIPASVSLTAYPINKNGSRISSVTISPVEINANANAQVVKISVAGEIRDLDGIEFEAKASAVQGKPLSPDMTISLSDIRPCVTGYYQAEL